MSSPLSFITPPPHTHTHTQTHNTHQTSLLSHFLRVAARSGDRAPDAGRLGFAAG